MLADIIRASHHKKMTLQDLYDYLEKHYPEHFPKDEFEDTKATGGGGGWRVSFPQQYLKWVLTQYLEYSPSRTFRE
jgi:hypothetical protein